MASYHMTTSDHTSLSADILIDRDTIELFIKFYHNISYAGELKINLLDNVTLGGVKRSLYLVLIKNPGLRQIHTSSYDLYLLFESRDGSKNPLVKELRFEDYFREFYEPSFNEESLIGILRNVDKKCLSSFSKEFFNCDIRLCISTSFGKVESFRNSVDEIELDKSEPIPKNMHVCGAESNVISLNNIAEWNFDSNNEDSYNNHAMYNPHDY